MSNWVSIDRVIVSKRTSPIDGRVVWDAPKSLWYLFHLCASIAALIFFASWSAVAICIILTAITICAGHSVGMHRLLIHRSFKTPKWVEYILVWLGVLVGMNGPFGMIRAHDMRDWHQRQAVCPDHPAHRASFFKDAWWQLHCQFELKRPPMFQIESEVANDRFYKLVDRTWMLQQLPLAIILFTMGGASWVLWGASVRIILSLTGHWAIGHFAHRKGEQTWFVKDLPVQGYDLPKVGLITFGEAFHGNHHAFPHSAKLGLSKGQHDLGFVFIRALTWLGLASDIQLPNSKDPRAGLATFHSQCSKNIF